MITSADDISKQEVAIIGAGIAGLALSIQLSRLGFKVTVYEQAEKLTEVGFGLQLSPNATAILSTLGLLAFIKSKSCSPESLVIRDYYSTKPLFTQKIDEHFKSRYQHPYLHIYRPDLVDSLHRAACEAGVCFRFGHYFQSYTKLTNQVQLHFANNIKTTCSLLCGADGVNSKVRAQLLPSAKVSFSNYVAWRGTVKTSEIDQELLPKKEATVWAGNNKHVVIYYLKDYKLINLVIVHKSRAMMHESWSHSASDKNVRGIFEDAPAEVAEIVNRCTFSHCWGLYQHQPLAKWYSDNVVLLGDACHPILPFQAQGAAMGIEDGYTLANELKILCKYGAVAKQHLNYKAALAAYQQKRSKRVRKVQKYSAQSGKIFHCSNFISKTARKLGLIYLSRRYHKAKTANFLYSHKLLND